MPDDPAVKGATGDAPQVSAPANATVSNNGTPQITSSDSPTAARVPFHQDPQIQEYIGRQVQHGIERNMQQMFGQKQQEDIVGKVANKLTEGLQLDANASKVIVQAIQEVSEHIANQKLQSQFAPVQEQVRQFTTQQRINAFAQSHDDFGTFQDSMVKLFHSLTPEEQSFISNSSNGIDFLYSKVKLSGMPSTPQSSRYSGTSPAGSGTNKLPVSNNTFKTANDALVKGDRDAYNKALLELASK